MYGIQTLCDRYSLASRKSLYTRLNGLKSKGINIELVTKEGRSYASEEIKKHLDDLNNHILNGEPVSSYQPVTKTEVLNNSPDHNTTTQHNDTTTQYKGTTTQQYIAVTPAQIKDIAIAVAQIVQPKPDPLAYMNKLMMLSEFGLEVTTKEVANLIGIKPRGRFFKRGSFEFVKVGRIGNQSAWKVVQVMPPLKQFDSKN